MYIIQKSLSLAIGQVGIPTKNTFDLLAKLSKTKIAPDRTASLLVFHHAIFVVALKRSTALESA